MPSFGLIGAGGMAETVLDALAACAADTAPRAAALRLALLVRPTGRAAAEARLERFRPFLASLTVHDDATAFLAERPDAVAECAGHDAVRQHGAAVLAAGCDLVVISAGVLADDALRAALAEAAEAGGSRLVLPAGAVGGIDVLAAARLSGLDAVTYCGRKPPRAWRGSPAERLLDLDALAEPATFFSGTAREAARAYPANANVAAVVALAGAGLDMTRVELVADPGIARNVHELSVRSRCADFTIRLEGRPSPTNAKTSLTAGYSVASALLNRAAAVVI